MTMHRRQGLPRNSILRDLEIFYDFEILFCQKYPLKNERSML